MIQADLDQAIACQREGVDSIPADHTGRADSLCNLGTALEARFKHAGRRDDLHQAIAAFRESTAALTAPPRVRLRAAERWGNSAVSGGLPDLAMAGYAAAIELLPVAAWHGLDQLTREQHLRSWAGLVSDAAAVAIATGHPVQANQDRTNPSLSAFLLHDQPLTLTDLAALNLPSADLTYLSACQTATGDLGLLDEARHLAGAMQQAGYRHVIATMWAIADRTAATMCDTIYARLCHADPARPDPADQPQSRRAPYALHHATTRLQNAFPNAPRATPPRRFLAQLAEARPRLQPARCDRRRVPALLAGRGSAT